MDLYRCNTDRQQHPQAGLPVDMTSSSAASIHKYGDELASKSCLVRKLDTGLRWRGSVTVGTTENHIRLVRHKRPALELGPLDSPSPVHQESGFDRESL